MITPDIWLKRLRRFVFVIIVGCVLFASLFVILTYLYPFVIALLFAWLLNPIILLCMKKMHCSRVLATLLTILSIFLILSTLISITAVEAIQAIHYLSERIPGYFEELFHLITIWIDDTLMPIFERLSQAFNRLHIQQQTTILDHLHNLLNQLARFGSSLLELFFVKLTNVLLALPNLVTITIFTFLGTFFISKDWDNLTNHYHRIIPKKIQRAIAMLYIQFKKTCFHYAVAQLKLSSIAFFTLFLGFLFIKIEHALTLALLISLIDLVPLIGTGLCFVPWLGYLFLTGDYSLTIQLAVLYSIVILQRQILEPKVLAQQIEANPLFILIITFGSFQLFGLIGVLLTPVFVILFQALHATKLLNRLWNYVKQGKF